MTLSFGYWLQVYAAIAIIVTVARRVGLSYLI
jgi:hypothetical protein